MIENLQYVYLIIYLFALLTLFAYGVNCYFLMIYYRLNYRRAIREHREIKNRFYKNFPSRKWPRVTIQLPVYND
jgi:hypothetical protein